MKNLQPNKQILIIFLFLLALIPNEIDAHAVQIGYCTSCNGDLRVWIEHWHGNDDPAGTSLDVTVTANGVPVTLVGAPNVAALNTPAAGLPGCVNPVTFFASCPNDANQWNDWVAYDFQGVACGVPISITVDANANTTVFTQDCGGMYPAVSANFIIPCGVNQLPDVVACAGDLVGAFNFSAGATWTNDNPLIGLPAVGNGNIPQFNAANSPIPQVANIEVTNACGVDKFLITVNPGPTSSFISNNGCPSEPIIFNDNSTSLGGPITSWSWDFGDGSPIFNGQNPPDHLFPTTGQYNVQLIASLGGCADTVVQSIEIYPTPLANYSTQDVCFGIPYVFGDLSNISNGTITNWDWSFGNANTSTAQNPTETYLQEGVYNTQLIVTSDNGCKDTLTQSIEVWPLPVVNFSSTEVCSDDSTHFTDLSTISNINSINNIVQWNWDFNGLGNSIIQNPAFIFNNEGAVLTTLTVTSDKGCVGTATLNALVYPSPTVSFGSPAAGCSPVCVNLSNTSSISTGTILNYQWQFGDGSGAGGQNPTYCFENSSRVATESYDVSLTATSDKGCVTTVTTPNMVTVYPIPYADFTIEPEITDVYNPNISFFDASQIASNWTWDFGDGNGSIINNPSHQYPETAQSYTVSLYIENSFGCADTVRREVIIKPAFAIWIPNVFTPDGDGINDLFFVQGFGLKEIQTLVFDRWGETVYEDQTILDGEEIDSAASSGWDGTYRGATIAIEDVFVYKVRVKDVFNEWHDTTGKVTLIK